MNEENTLKPSVNTDFKSPSAPAPTAENRGSAELPPQDPTAAQTEQNTADPLLYQQLVLPEDVLFDESLLADFKQLAHQMNLTEEQVQQLVDFEAKNLQRQDHAAHEEKRSIIAKWAEQTKTAYGANLEREISYALRAADQFGGPDFRALLEETGLGNHPVIIRTLSGIGRAISEDISTGGAPAAPQDKTFAEALYGKKA